MFQFIIILLVILFSTPVFGDVSGMGAAPLGFGKESFSEEMQGDRPDFTEGTQTVDPGHIQVELGYLYSYDDEVRNGHEESVISETLIRLGLAQGIEGRIAYLGGVYEKGPDGESFFSAVEDFSLGIKSRLHRGSAKLPHLSMITEAGLPIDKDNGLSDRVEPRVKLLWAFDLVQILLPLSISGNTNISYVNTDTEEYPEAAVSFSLGIPVVGELSVYQEYYSIFPLGPDNELREHYYNGGFTYSLVPNVQFDIRVGIGLNREADDLYSGLGMTARM